MNAETTAASVPAAVAEGDSPWVGSTAASTHRVRGLSELRAAALRTPSGQLGFSLVSAHLSEAIRLVNTDRRVTVAWHRLGGPALLRAVVEISDDAPVRIPVVIDGRDVAAGLERFLDALSGAGSLRMRTDIERHRVFLLSLPGLDLAGFDLAGLESMDAAG